MELRLDNGHEEKHKRQLRLIRKQVVVIEVVVNLKHHYLNGLSKNGELSQVNHLLKQEKDIYQKKQLNLYQQENMQEQQLRREEIKHQVNNLVNNQSQ